MATRQSIEDCIQRCESAIFYAEEQYEAGSLQEHYQDEEYTDALQNLEAMNLEIFKLEDSSNAQQREQLNRARLQVQQLQNKMILLNHDRPLNTWH